jgi:hypothetical protein
MVSDILESSPLHNRPPGCASSIGYMIRLPHGIVIELEGATPTWIAALETSTDHADPADRRP